MKATQARPTPYQANNAAFPLGTRPTVNNSPPSAAAAAAPAASTAKSVAAAGHAPSVAKKPVAKSAAASSAAPQHTKISQQRYDNAKTSDPFASSAKKTKSAFSAAYALGQLPVRLQSSASKYSLQWEEYARVGFSKDLLVLCAAGLVETQHPFVKLAPMMFEELIARCEGHSEMLADCTTEVTGHLRAALLDTAVTGTAIHCTEIFAVAAGPLMLSSLRTLIPALARFFKDKKHADAVLRVLGILETTCGPDATKFIKSKIPTYQ